MTSQSKGNRHQRNEGEWRALLSRFDKSGLGVDAFCQREAISATSFYRWRTLLRNENVEEEHSDNAPPFVDLGTLTAATPSRPKFDLKLELGDGLTLHLARH